MTTKTNSVDPAFDAQAVETAVKTITDLMVDFNANAMKTTNKAASRRARTISTELAKALKNYRAISIKA